MGADESTGVHRYERTQNRDKWRHRWSCRGMNGCLWSGKFPQNTYIMRGGDRGTIIRADCHGCAYMGAGEYIGVGGHAKEPRKVTNG